MELKKRLFVWLFFLKALHIEASLCEDGYIEINKTVGENNVTECNCNCTMQDNTIYIQNLKNPSFYYKIENVSTVSKKLNRVTIDINGKMDYFLSNKKVCKTIKLPLESKAELFIYTLLPDSSSRYCYELSGYINKKGKLILIDKTIPYKKMAKTHIEK